MLKLALLSFWHVHAKDYLQDAAQHPDTEVVAVWDEIYERGQQEAQKRGLQVYQHLDDLLNSPDIDGVIVTTPTNLHEEIMVAAARAKKHIFTEKVLAATKTAATTILNIAQENGIKLCVSLPRLYHGYTRAIKDIIDQGALGQITYARVRLAHNGALSTPQHPSGWLPDHFYSLEQACGGALIDLGCHPVYLLQEFLGRPHAVQATFGHFTKRAVEDQAVVTLDFGEGVIGVAETGFVSSPAPIQIELRGTLGRVQYGAGLERLEIHPQKGSPVVNIDLPEDLPTPFELWVNQIQQGVDGSANLAHAYALTAVMEAAYLSAKENRRIVLDF